MNYSGGRTHIVCTSHLLKSVYLTCSSKNAGISNSEMCRNEPLSALRSVYSDGLCIPSSYLMTDFLIRISAIRLPHDLQPNSKSNREFTPQTTLLPDGLQHPKFAARGSNRGGYMLCNREAVPLLIERGAYRRVGHYLSVHALFAEQIAHLLRLRVLQELELLGDRMASLLGRPGAIYNSRIIRRLTRQEWKHIRSTGVIPYPKAVAILVVPPLNRDPVSQTRPEASMSASPLVECVSPSLVNPPLRLPLSILHPTTASKAESDSTLPQARIPLYNGVSLFPARPQRAALYDLLIRLLDIEKRSRNRTSSTPDSPRTADVVNDWDKKGSHAFLLCSDAEVSRRADVAAVGIALWRVRMFEGCGWDDASEDSNRWVKTLMET